MVLHTGGFAPQDHATDLMHWLAVERVLLGIPNAVFIWVLLGAAIVVMLKRTPLGRYIYAIGNRESATYLSGVNTKLVIIACFAISGMCSALAGVLLAGYSSKGYQAMGDPYLLPAIAAVVLGGTHILGGRGSYLGTVAGVILISPLASILSVMQLPHAGRQIISGCVIVGLLLVYGRAQKGVGCSTTLPLPRSSTRPRRRGARRHPHPRRPRQLPRHRRRRHPHLAAGLHPLGHADARGRTTDHLRLRHRRHAAGLRAGTEGGGLTRQLPSPPLLHSSPSGLTRGSMVGPGAWPAYGSRLALASLAWPG